MFVQEFNTFQGVIITDGELTYAVFIYECGGMEWGRGVIGWQFNTTTFEANPLSGQENNYEIGCTCSNKYSAIAYTLSKYSNYSN